MDAELHGSPAPRHSLSGTVTLVQERRFQLVDANGVAHLFLLAPEAEVEPGALRALARSGAQVEVQYREPSELVAHVATKITYTNTTESLK